MDTKQWHEWRRKGIGGSDIGVLLGYSQYCTPLELYRLKVGEIQPSETSDYAQAGKDMELPGLEWFEKRYSVKLKKNVPVSGLDRSTDEWLRGTFDGMFKDMSGVVDCKFSKSDGWGEPGTDNVPMGIYLQMQWYLMLINAECAFVIKRDMLTFSYCDPYVILHNRKIQDTIQKIAYHFWHNHVLKKIPPKNAIYGTTEINKKIISLRKINEQLKPLKKNKEELETEIKEFMRQHEFLISPDDKKKTKNGHYEKENFDKKQFKLDYPDLYSQYVTETKQRRFYA